MLAFAINLDRRPDRLTALRSAWEDHFSIVRVRAVDAPKQPAMGCKMSHLLALKDALSSGPCAVVLEDDAAPTPAFTEIGRQCIDDALKHESEWDYVNLGPYLDIQLPNYRRTAKMSPTCSRFFLQADYSHQTHFVIYNQRSVRLLEQAIDSNLPLDVFLGINAVNQWVPIRLLATQIEGVSDISGPEHNAKQWYDRSEALLSGHQRLGGWKPPALAGGS